MFKKSTNTFAAMGFLCSIVMQAEAVAPSVVTASTPAQPSQTSNYSILTREQVKERKRHRVFISQDIAHTVDSDPVFPYHANPLYSFAGYEYFYNPAFSIGAILTYTHEKDKYTKDSPGIVKSDTVANVSGFAPYVNYSLNETWLLTGQIGGYIEDYKDTSFTTAGGIIKSRNQVFTPAAEGYVTWIGPDTTYTASVRAGVYYTNQRFRSLIDSTGAFFATRHFEAAATSVSARLKYFPDHDRWNAFLHVETDYRFFAGARPGVLKPDNGRNTMLYQVGPGIHYKIDNTWELRLMALHTIGFGYGKEERIGIRLRAAF
jgi:hypothetical protein